MHVVYVFCIYLLCCVLYVFVQYVITVDVYLMIVFLGGKLDKWSIFLNTPYYTITFNIHPSVHTELPIRQNTREGLEI